MPSARALEEGAGLVGNHHEVRLPASTAERITPSAVPCRGRQRAGVAVREDRASPSARSAAPCSRWPDSRDVLGERARPRPAGARACAAAGWAASDRSALRMRASAQNRFTAVGRLAARTAKARSIVRRNPAPSARRVGATLPAQSRRPRRSRWPARRARPCRGFLVPPPRRCHSCGTELGRQHPLVDHFQVAIAPAQRFHRGCLRGLMAGLLRSACLAIGLEFFHYLGHLGLRQMGRLGDLPGAPVLLAQALHFDAQRRA